MCEHHDKQQEVKSEFTRVWFMGVPLDLLTRSQTMGRIERAMSTKTRLQHVVLNVRPDNNNLYVGKVPQLGIPV